jgi:hypothetical protein
LLVRDDKRQAEAPVEIIIVCDKTDYRQPGDIDSGTMIEYGSIYFIWCTCYVSYILLSVT